MVHIVRDLDAASGGPSRSIPALAEHQSRREGVRITVVYRDRGNPVARLPGEAVEYHGLAQGSLSRGKHLRKLLPSGPLAAAETIIHLHGLWSPVLHHAAQFAQKHYLPYVISTRGMLANWALTHKGLKKKIAWRLYQENDSKMAACLLASSEYEREDVLRLLPGSEVVVIPNGCEEPPDAVEMHSILPAGEGARWAVALGRMHPVKGYAELIQAWSSLRPRKWKLVIAGPDESGYCAVLEQAVKNQNLVGHVFLLDEVSDAQKWSLLDQCELFVAPSKTENFGMAIAEALRSGKPVITTTGTPWKELIDCNCGWWVKPDAAALEQALREATQASAEALSERGSNGRKLIEARYSWEPVAARTIELYRTILDGGA